MSLILVGVASICAAHHPTSFIAADRGAQDGKPKSLVAVGDPAVEILKTAQAESIDLIVLAARGSGSDVQTGSVVEKVVRESSTPVVIVPSSGDTGVIPGIDGRKMSKSYGNDIALLASAEALRERTMHIVTDSQPPEAPKDPEHCNLFAIYRHIADGKAVERLRGRYLAGGVAYREVKEMLATELIDRFEAPRRRYSDLVDNEEKLFMILSGGARAARVDAGNRKVVSWQQAARKRRPLEKLTPGDDDG
ncbi:MAG: universal stress protein [Desulfosarcinaceae bacterium]